MGIPQGSELLIILLVVLLLFGAKKLPELARSVGQSTREFRKGASEEAEESTQSHGTSGAQPTEGQNQQP